MAVLIVVPSTVLGLSGAIFTTTETGSRVNANIYDSKDAVYLDGGPGQNAPSTAAGLPAGDYYFQVTDPSGKVLLSQDAVKCREFHVNSAGVIDYVYPASCLVKVRGQWVTVDCTHKTGIDTDHPELGAITVQLMPYANTPNRGGVYKVWVTPISEFVGDPNQIDNPQYFHGFVPAHSKTDNYKVKGKPFTPPTIIVKKFDDSNANGIWDVGEQEITGWSVDVTDPLVVTNEVFTPAVVFAVPEGTWTLVEDTPAGWLQTAAYLDGVALAVSPTVNVNVAGLSGETHTVVFGNVQLGDITGCKFYDRDADGIWDAAEPAIQGWKVSLSGTAVNGTVVGPLEATTGACGCYTWDDLLPGSYVVSELFPSGNWVATTPTSYAVTLSEGGAESRSFGNVCFGYAGFGTKGYWHNKNGLGETTLADIAYLNSLLPWQSPSSYFEAGDEPINGYFQNGTPVAAANGDWGELVAPAGSALAEQSQFLVDSNSGGDPREQLAQQLDAFIMNARHRLDSPDAVIQVNGSWLSAATLISQAVQVWATGTDAQRTDMQALICSLNESSAVPFVHYYPCSVVY